MFDLTTLDYIYIGIILASTVWATIRGGVYETIATLSWVLAAVCARFTSPWLDDLLQRWFHLTESTVGTLVASYFVVFFAILLIAGFFNQKLRDKIQDSMMNVTDHTLGVIFGIIRGIVVMGVFYWITIWYYSDAPHLPSWVANARTRPVMQLTAIKMDRWFIPGPDNKLLARDQAGSFEAMEIYNNLINPAVSETKPTANSVDANVPDTKKAETKKNDTEQKKSVPPRPAPKPVGADAETGYRSSERTALENQLLQIETAARAEKDE
ncbi:MAG: CvpA family protein [Alphaproteobacteria bacterium]|nr:CvpA family protein [Alphaproteobacteria bacterium]